jgi:hypothetical protein
LDPPVPRNVRPIKLIKKFTPQQTVKMCLFWKTLFIEEVLSAHEIPVRNYMKLETLNLNDITTQRPVALYRSGF